MPIVPSPDWFSWAFWARDPESLRNLFLIGGGSLAGVGASRFYGGGLGTSTAKRRP
jgi:hypothetical protein